MNGDINEFIDALQFAENSEKLAKQNWFVIPGKINKLFGVSLTGTPFFCRLINTMVLQKIIRMVFVTLQSDLLRKELQIALVRIK